MAIMEQGLRLQLLCAINQTQLIMNAFNVFLHRGHSIGYFAWVYVIIFTFIMVAAMVAEGFIQ
jgi:hypothetical protein